jgi:hypothetical protein
MPLEDWLVNGVNKFRRRIKEQWRESDEKMVPMKNSR